MRTKVALALIFALITTAVFPAHAVSVRKDAERQTYCNPLDLNYRHTGSPTGSREAADPIVVLFKGDYYLFASKCGGYWWSPDLRDWTFVAMHGVPPKAIEEYAPGVVEHEGSLYYIVCRDRNLYKTDEPKSGKWELAAQIPRGVVDPGFLKDDDGKIFFYYGCDKLFGVELDPKNDWQFVGEPAFLYTHDTERNGWEVQGDYNLLGRTDPKFKGCWTEGAWPIKYDGHYYLAFAGPGTKYLSYADSVAVADHPLGPYSLQDHNPFCLRMGGFAPGGGHGGMFKDKQGHYWQVATTVISVRTGFERRINLFPVHFDKNGVVYADTYLGADPIRLPVNSTRNPALGGQLSNSRLLSFKKTATASSSGPKHPVEYAFDENIRTEWAVEKTVPDYGRPLEANWKRSFWNNSNFSGNPVHEESCRTIEDNFQSERPGIGRENFSNRAVAPVEVTQDGRYRFHLNGDDGVRLKVNGQIIVEDWGNHGPRWSSGEYELKAGQTYTLTFEHMQAAGGAVSELRWEPVKSPEAGNKKSGDWLAVDLGKVCDIGAIQLFFVDYNVKSVQDTRDAPHRYTIHHSLDGVNWEETVDRSQSNRDAPHAFLEFDMPFKARHLRVTNVEMPYGGDFALGEFRIFGQADGQLPPEVASLKAVRGKDRRDMTVSWQKDPDVERYIIRYGVLPEKLYGSIEVDGEIANWTYRGLSVPLDYYVAVDTVNMTGITRGTQVIQVR